MPSFIHQAADKFFKLSMSELSVATEFIQVHVPAELLEKMDISTLKLEKQSFIDEAYKANEADMVYSIQLNHSSAYIYILCEQQTQVDKRMAFRLWVYIIRLMESHLRRYPESTLPLVYPLVVYSGKKIWNAPMEIFPLFGEQEALARQWLLKPYQLIDIQRLSDDELQKNTWSGLVEFALKHREVRDFGIFLEILLPWIRRLEEQRASSGIFVGKVVLQYVLNGINADDIDFFFEKIHDRLTGKLRGDIMTLAQQLELRGIEKGRQEGIQQGIQQAKIAMILELLEQRFGVISSEHTQRIVNADIWALNLWSKRILAAASVEEIFVSTVD